ncbi:hypothetical protein CRM22_009363, partial [Opisthorchis felineus]
DPTSRIHSISTRRRSSVCSRRLLSEKDRMEAVLLLNQQSHLIGGDSLIGSLQRTRPSRATFGRPGTSTIPIPSIPAPTVVEDLSKMHSDESSLAPDPSSQTVNDRTSPIRAPLDARRRLSWRRPTDYRFIPFKQIRSPSASFVSSGGTLRRSQRIRPPARRDPNVAVVYDWEPNSIGIPYKKPVGLAVWPTDEEVRRRQRFLQQKQARFSDTKMRLLRVRQRAKRLERLAQRYRKRTGPVDTANHWPLIQLDDDVHWAADDQLCLPCNTLDPSTEQQVIFPGTQISFKNIATCEHSVYTVPAFSGVWSSERTNTKQGRVVPQLEVDADLTRVVSDEQQRRQLHYDPDSVNLFQLIQQTPSTSSTSAPIQTPSPWAVQIANYAFRLKSPCFILIPKGIPYKFINATRDDLLLLRSIYS